jgi:hypothetical protein
MHKINKQASGKVSYYGHSCMEETEDHRHQSRTGRILRIMYICRQSLYCGDRTAIHRQSDSQYDDG